MPTHDDSKKSDPPASGPTSEPKPNQDAYWEAAASPGDFQKYMQQYGSYVGGSDPAAAAGPSSSAPAQAPASAAPASYPFENMFNERLEGEEEHLAAEDAAAEAARAAKGGS